jgi:hypothetical protein
VRVDARDDMLLGRLVRHLSSEHPDLQLRMHAGQLGELSDHALCVLRVAPADAPVLNVLRPIVAQRALRLVLWCDRKATEALRREAPDFSDWISHTVACLDTVPPFFRATIEAATAAPGVVDASLSPVAFLRHLRAAAGAECVHPLDASKPYGEVLNDLSRVPKAHWAVFRYVTADALLWRVRWAVAESHHHARPVLLNPRRPSPGWWSLAAGAVTRDAAERALSGAVGPEAAERLLLLVDREPQAVRWVAELVSAGHSVTEMSSLLVSERDPGAALASELWRRRGRDWLRQLVLSGGGLPAALGRALGSDEALCDAYMECLRSVGRRLSTASPAAAAWWSAHPSSTWRRPPPVDGATFAPAVVEAMLRRGGASPVARMFRAEAAADWDRSAEAHWHEPLDGPLARRAEALLEEERYGDVVQLVPLVLRDAEPARHAALRAVMSRAYIALHRLDQARAALGAEDGSWPISLARAEIEVRAGGYDEARRRLVGVLEGTSPGTQQAPLRLRASTLLLELELESAARAEIRGARDLVRDELGPELSMRADHLWALVRLADAHVHLGESERAGAVLKDLGFRLEAVRPRPRHLDGWLHVVSGRLWARAGMPGKALTHLARAEVLLRRKLGARHPDTLRARFERALARGIAGDPAARDEQERALAGLSAVLGAEHPVVCRYRRDVRD